MAIHHKPDTGQGAHWRLGILASHSGSNFQAIIDACADRTLRARIAVAISNNSNAPALERARRAGIPAIHLSSATHPGDTLDDAILETLDAHQVDWVILAGYMRKLGPHTLQHFRNRIVNIHPSLLPRHGGKGMYGLNVHRAVLAAGDKETGVTIHRVESEYDTGEIIARRRVPVLDTDTPESLAARVLIEEHDLLVTTLARLCNPEQEKIQ